MKFGLFFFSAAGDGVYDLMLSAAERADQVGLGFVSTPERHFHEFGGAFPNPLLTSAAIASATHRIEVRTGSLVTPLHNPVRLCEDLAMIDGISEGRLAISLGSGWNVDDFRLAPGVYEGRVQRMYDDLALIRRVWAEGTWAGAGPDGKVAEVRVHPRPVQPELPVWLTASRSVETFVSAGRLGTNVLTHLETQSVEELQTKIAAYRLARADAGHDRGVVTVMLHTHVRDDHDVAVAVGGAALHDYLKTSVDLEAVAVRHGGTMSGGRVGPELLQDERARDLVAGLAARRYLDGHALIGGVEECTRRAAVIANADVDEIACLADFVPSSEDVLTGVDALAKVAAAFTPATDHAAYVPARCQGAL